MKMMLQLVHDREGQMTVELAIVLPVLLIVAVVATNALDFFSFCASFDRAAHNAVRIHAVSTAYGQDPSQSKALVEQSLQDRYEGERYIEVVVQLNQVGVGYQEYVATAEYTPTLFGLHLQDEILGIPLPRLAHSTRFVVETYKPGVIA